MMFQMVISPLSRHSLETITLAAVEEDVRLRERAKDVITDITDIMHHGPATHYSRNGREHHHSPRNTQKLLGCNLSFVLTKLASTLATRHFGPVLCI